MTPAHQHPPSAPKVLLALALLTVSVFVQLDILYHQNQQTAPSPFFAQSSKVEGSTKERVPSETAFFNFWVRFPSTDNVTALVVTVGNSLFEIGVQHSKLCATTDSSSVCVTDLYNDLWYHVSVALAKTRKGYLRAMIKVNENDFQLLATLSPSPWWHFLRAPVTTYQFSTDVQVQDLSVSNTYADFVDDMAGHSFVSKSTILDTEQQQIEAVERLKVLIDDVRRLEQSRQRIISGEADTAQDVEEAQQLARDIESRSKEILKESYKQPLWKTEQDSKDLIASLQAVEAQSKTSLTELRKKSAKFISAMYENRKN